ncbi:hypothetical protein F8388_024865 [Cannabis sativa]|uniref:ALOG domain-containing protein n=2 Tax=Cannabis sativa TaxID=3483 RepID=A0A7J6H6Y6_CANSA|nr:hypothetical protein F8388_024865 [Cannabis sativa]KAF4400410.1 hypothetical protein G4B88_018752 [Cannabis sativa]
MSAAVAAAAAAVVSRNRSSNSNSSRGNTKSTTAYSSSNSFVSQSNYHHQQRRRRLQYDLLKERDWDNFGQYLRNHNDPPITISQCRVSHVLKFLRYLDQFGETKIHDDTCQFYGQLHPPETCPCPNKEFWGNLDGVVGRLRAAFSERNGNAEINPFGAIAVGDYVTMVRQSQARARGIG